MYTHLFNCAQIRNTPLKATMYL